MDDVEFQLLVLLGLGDQTGADMWSCLEELKADHRLCVTHDSTKDETWLSLADDEDAKLAPWPWCSRCEAAIENPAEGWLCPDCGAQLPALEERRS